MYTIYCHIFPNGKRYVGLTSTSLSKRWQDGNGYKTCPLVDRAIQKYGWGNVTHEVLAECESKEEAEILERKFISEFDTLNPNLGYNILPGGDVSDNYATSEMRYKLGNGNRGRHHSDEEKKRISEGVKRAFDRPEGNKRKGYKMSHDTRVKMSNSQRDIWCENEERRAKASVIMANRMADPDYKKRIVENLNAYRPNKKGIHISQEHKNKISQSLKGKYAGENSPLSKPVNQLRKSGEFIRKWENSEAAEVAGIALATNIRKCCNHYPHCFTAGGFKWEWSDN